MSKYLLFIVCIFCLGYAGGSIADQSAKVLERNPFLMPKHLIQQLSSSDDKKLAKDDDAELVLRATLTSTDHSIANVNGKMLVLGDEIAGYKLTKIQIGSATLISGSKTLVLQVNEDYKELE